MDLDVPTEVAHAVGCAFGIEEELAADRRPLDAIGNDAACSQTFERLLIDQAVDLGAGRT